MQEIATLTYSHVITHDSILQVQNVGQIKFVADEDLQALGMSRPEIRRLKKFFHKYYPQTYLSKFKKVRLCQMLYM